MIWSDKDVRVSWNKPRQCWIIRFWSETDHDWVEDSAYFVKDVNPETELGWIPEEMLCRFYDLQDLGYTIRFVK